MKKIYAIFGGNFDPIHYGHIISAQNLSKEILIKKIILLPNHNPPHRDQTKTTIKDKLEMINRAIKNNNLFEISLLETTQKETKKKFYTIDTLKKIRLKIGFFKSLCFIIGEDNLNNFNLWKNWKKILFYTHLLIIPRKNKNTYNDELKKWIILNTTKNKNYLRQKPSGLIFFSSIPHIDISSTQIRKNFYNRINVDKLLPEEVKKYIFLKNLY